jgi:methionine-rich copper-binding protein CopC
MSPGVRWTTRTVAGIGAVLVSLLVSAAPAAAHARVVRTTPASGATIDGRLQVISLAFDDPVRLVPRSLVVTGASGAPQTTGAPRVVQGGRLLEAALSDRLPAGRYFVGWRILSDDSHIESGSFGFTVAAVGAASSGATDAGTLPPAPAQPRWPVVLAAVMAAVACLGAALVVVRGLAAVRAAGAAPAATQVPGLDPYPDEGVTVIPASKPGHAPSRH